MDRNTDASLIGCWKHTNCSGILPTPRQAVSGAMLNSKTFVIFGGGAMEGPYDNRTFFLDLNSNSWSEVNYENAPPSPRGVMALTTLDNKMYIFGGYTGNSHLNDFYFLNFGDKKWTKLVPNSQNSTWPSERRGATFVTYGNKLYLYGGTNSRGKSASEDVMCYDPITNTWSHLLSTGIRGFRNASAIINDRLLIFGGDIYCTTDPDKAGISDLTFEYNFSTNTWTEIKTTGIVPKLEAPSGVILKNKYFVIFGGFTGSHGPSNRSFALNLETKEWKEIPLIMYNNLFTDYNFRAQGRTLYNCPEPRVFFAIAHIEYGKIFPDKQWKCPITGNEIKDSMLIFGGRLDLPGPQFKYFNDVWKLEISEIEQSRV